MTLYPFVWVSEKLTKLISRGKAIHNFSRDEFIAMARLGYDGGHIHDNESRIIQNLFRYGSVKAMDVMTPLSVVFALAEDRKVSEVFEYLKDKPFSRILIYKTGIDDITGFVLRGDILLSKASDQQEEMLKSLKRDISVVPETVSLPMLLNRLLKDRQHIALVVDEYGGTRGVVTLEDLVETLLGVEIMDEIDRVEDMRVLARRLWIKRAKALGIEEERVETTAEQSIALDGDSATLHPRQ
nr:CBS domain-containing protein [Desulfobulbaceae bacterium]